MIPAITIFAGVVASGVFHLRIAETGEKRLNCAGLVFGATLIAIGATSLAGGV